MPDGQEYSIYGATIVIDWRTSDTTTWRPWKEKAGMHPFVYWRDGLPYCVYVSGTDTIKEWNVQSGTERTIMTGTYPCVAVNEGGNHTAFAYRSGTGYKCRIYSPTGGALTAENVIGAGAPITDALDAPGALLWWGNGVLEFSWSNSTTVNKLVSRDYGKTWTLVI